MDLTILDYVHDNLNSIHCNIIICIVFIAENSEVIVSSLKLIGKIFALNKFIIMYNYIQRCTYTGVPTALTYKWLGQKVVSLFS